MKGYYRRENVDVECILNAQGKFHLLAMYWGEKRFVITDYQLKAYGENHTGNPCNMYICTINGKQKKLYFSDGAFFVEVANV